MADKYYVSIFGKIKINSMKSPSTEIHVISPPNNCIVCLMDAKPSPVPSALLVLYPEKNCLTISGEAPPAVSLSRTKLASAPTSVAIYIYLSYSFQFDRRNFLLNCKRRKLIKYHYLGKQS